MSRTRSQVQGHLLKRRTIGLPLLLGALVTSGGCGAETLDPLEPLNRQAFAFNAWFTRTVSVAAGPEETANFGPLGIAAANVLTNLTEPMTFANALMQGRECAAGVTLRRFLTNSTLGLGGLFDIAKTYGGLAGYETDFGTTLGLWGAPLGPYLVVPFVGPSSARDAAGYALEYAADPADLALVKWAGQGAAAGRSSLDIVRSISAGNAHLETSSDNQDVDDYARQRAAYIESKKRGLEPYDCPDALQNAFWTPQK